MNIEVYAICYNEEFMLPFFLEHYSSIMGVSKIIIYDNYSTDNTVTIAKTFTKCPVEVIYYDSNNELNDQIYLDIKNNCWRRSKADWVIVCDIDEFLYIKSNELNKYQNCDVLKCNGVQMVSDILPTHASPITNQIKFGVSDNNYSKCVIFKPTITNINFAPGCHSCNPTSEITSTDILLLHYKFINIDFVIKNYSDRANRLSAINKQNGFGIHYQFTQETIQKIFDDLNQNKRLIL